jgi:hypothetical protein
MPQEMKYEVENPEIQAKLKELAQMLDTKMPDGWGFTLLLFEYSPKDSLFYISSAKRKDMMNTMREFIRKFGLN